MHAPITIEPRIATLELDPIMDAPTAPHCGDCGETLYSGRCLNSDCLTAGARASRGGATRKFERGIAAGPMFAPRAWTLGGRVD